MAEENEKLLTLKELEELGLQDVDPTTIDSSDFRAYRQKSYIISNQNLFAASRAYLPDFIAAIFERPLDDSQPVEPFEERLADRYIKWREEENAGLEHDYSGSQFQYNPIVFFKSKRKRKRKKNGEEEELNTHRLIFKDDWQTTDWLQTRLFALMSPITYVGKTCENKNARYLYSFVVDLDGVGVEQLQLLITYIGRVWPGGPLEGLPIIPLPNIIVNSGHGLHLYYTLKYPLALFEWNAKLLQRLCRLLYQLVWYPEEKKKGYCGTTTVQKVHCLGIYHSFRLPETMTKPLCVDKNTGEAIGHGVPIEAWTTEAKPYSLFDLAQFFKLNDEYKKNFSNNILEQLERGGRLLNPKRLTLEQARKKYGEEWFQNRGKLKGRFKTNRALYDWWLHKLQDPTKNGVKFGYRYYCIMALAAFANKCEIPFEELKNDAYSLIPVLDRLSPSRDKEFRKFDADRALTAYKNQKSVKWTPEMLSKWSDVKIERTKRNHRKRTDHLKIARAVQEIDDPKGKWRTGNGRKVATLENSKEAKLVEQWMVENSPCTNKSQCARDLGMDRKTVRKWWKAIEEKISEEYELPPEYVEEDFNPTDELLKYIDDEFIRQYEKLHKRN